MEKVLPLLSIAFTLTFLIFILTASYFSTYFPMARIIVYTSLACIGAFIKAQHSIENRFELELKTQSRRDLGKVHEKFLNLLSKGMRDKNKSISETVEFNT